MIELTPHIVRTKQKGIWDKRYIGPFHTKKEAEEWVEMKKHNAVNFDEIEIIALEHPFLEAA